MSGIACPNCKNIMSMSGVCPHCGYATADRIADAMRTYTARTSKRGNSRADDQIAITYKGIDALKAFREGKGK